MIKRILIPFDGSPSSEIALQVGLQLAKGISAEVAGLFVADERRFVRQTPEVLPHHSEPERPPEPELRPRDELVAELKQIEKEERRLRGIFEQECESIGIDAKFIAQFGEAPLTIIEMAKRVDLVVLGSRGAHSGIQNAKDGQTVLSLVRETTRPVLVCPHNWGEHERIVVGYDGTAGCERALQRAAELSEILGIRQVHLLSVNDPTKPIVSSQESAIAYLSGYQAEVVSVVRSGKASDQILKYSEEVGADIIVLGAFGLSKLRDLVFGSTTAQIVQQARCGVLISS